MSQSQCAHSKHLTLANRSKKHVMTEQADVCIFFVMDRWFSVQNDSHPVVVWTDFHSDSDWKTFKHKLSHKIFVAAVCSCSPHSVSLTQESEFTRDVQPPHSWRFCAAWWCSETNPKTTPPVVQIIRVSPAGLHVFFFFFWFVSFNSSSPFLTIKIQLTQI